MWPCHTFVDFRIHRRVVNIENITYTHTRTGTQPPHTPMQNESHKCSGTILVPSISFTHNRNRQYSMWGSIWCTHCTDACAGHKLWLTNFDKFMRKTVTCHLKMHEREEPNPSINPQISNECRNHIYFPHFASTKKRTQSHCLVNTAYEKWAYNPVML